MKFPARSLTAVVGESGSGKSTIASLISGKLRGFEGSIQIDGTDINQIIQESLQKSITTVSYFGYIFSGSVRSNLLMANPNASDEMMKEALKSVKLYEEFGMENALDKEIQSEGTNLSGGQRQRLNLARALLHDSQVYIFDEATSNIDVESENHIMEVIYQLAKTKTVILITHRLFNSQNADKIYVLKDNVVTESGTHEALLNAKDEYARLWNTQQNIELYLQKGA